MTLSTPLFNQYNDKTAVITDCGQRYTYSDLNQYSDLLYKQINKRCLVFCLCQNSIESLIGYVSFLTNKVVPLMLDAHLESSLLINLIKVYQPQYLWLPTGVHLNLNVGQSVYTYKEYSLIRVKGESQFQLYSDLGMLLTTSGSTGSPKLVRLSYLNIQSNAEAIAEYLSIHAEERPITILPMHYSFGLSIINSHLLKGATILLTNKSIMEKEFWAFLKSEQATSISGVPYTFEMLKRLRFFRMELPSVTTITQAGGKLNHELNHEFATFCESAGKKLFVMYGQTEATARMSYLPHNHAISKLGSVGVAIPGGQFNLIDENGNVINEHNTVGELVYNGANVSLGYAECGDDLAKGDENNGVLRTGDLAKRDEDNYHYIVGRKKRFIKLYGNRINLDEVERLLKALIPDCACSGEDDKMVIFITESNREDEVRKYISTKTGININAFAVKVINEIPKNSSGKTIYTKLKI